jgi:integrase
VRLNSRALAAIKRQKKHTFMAGAHVFNDPRYAQPWNEERAFRRSYWTPMLRALGIRYRRPYNMRHTYATMMLMAGAKPGWCAKQMGHSIEIFHSTYAKWIDGQRDDFELARVEEFIAPAGSTAKKSAAT